MNNIINVNDILIVYNAILIILFAINMIISLYS